MKNVRKVVLTGLVLALSAMLYACGSGDNNYIAPAAPATKQVSGVVAQGFVSGSTVFIDYNGNGIKDANEPSTTSSAGGAYTITGITAASNDLITSLGGTDTLTNKPAITMVAPITAKNVTVLTTMVALTPPAQQDAMKAAIEKTGVKFDANIATEATPAALNLVTATQIVVSTISETIKTGLGTTTAASAQYNAVQKQTILAIADTIRTATTTQQAQLGAPATLAALMNTAGTAAATSINANNSNITIPPATAATIGTTAAVTSSNAVLNLATPLTSATIAASTATASASTADVVAETTAISATDVTAVNTAVTTGAATAASTTTATTTSPAYTAPTFATTTTTSSVATTTTTTTTIKPTGTTGGSGSGI